MLMISQGMSTISMLPPEFQTSSFQFTSSIRSSVGISSKYIHYRNLGFLSLFIPLVFLHLFLVPLSPTGQITQKYVNHELPDVQAGFRKGRGTRHQIANIHWIIKKAREFQKNIYFCFIDYAKAFDCVDTTNCGKF